ncbi:MAG: hypothetical protein ACKER6_01395 [Candidatus Hodgkinia cicadicola]
MVRHMLSLTSGLWFVQLQMHVDGAPLSLNDGALIQRANMFGR